LISASLRSLRLGGIREVTAHVKTLRRRERKDAEEEPDNGGRSKDKRSRRADSHERYFAAVHQAADHNHAGDGGHRAVWLNQLSRSTS